MIPDGKKQKFATQNILSLGLHPGLNPDTYYKLLTNSVKAVVIEGFGSGNLPSSSLDWMKFISTAVDKNILVYLGSQSPHGVTDLNIYACGRGAQDAGALSLGDMTTEAALVKLMVLLGNEDELDIVRRLMDESLAGELS